MTVEEIIQEIKNLRESGDYLKAAATCREGLQISPDNPKILSEFSLVKEKTDSLLSVKVKTALEEKNFLSAIESLKDWLKIVGERQDILDLMLEVYQARKKTRTEESEAREQKIKELIMEINTAIADEDFKKFSRCCKELLNICQPDEPIKEKIFNALKRYDLKRKKIFARLFLSDALLFSGSLVTVGSAFFILSSDLAFLVGLIGIATSTFLAFILFLAYIIPYPEQSLHKRIFSFKE